MGRSRSGNQFMATLVFSLLFAITCAGQASAGAVVLDISAQPLADSLTSVALSFDLQIAFFPEVVEGIEAPAVVGSFTADQAFSRLLEDTALEYRYIDQDSVTIGKKKDVTEKTPTPSGEDPGTDKPAQGEDSGNVEGDQDEAQDPSADDQPEEPDNPAGDDEEPNLKAADAPAERSFAGEIVVTAEKREQELQDVPISIQAFGAESLDAVHIRDLSEVMTLVPGASEDVSYGAGQRTFQLRGVATGAGDPTVGYYLDDIAFFGVGQGLAPMGRTFDIERIEVLRGPQGTLYGNGSMGGTVRFIPMAPNLNRVEGSIRAAYSGTDGGDPGNYLDAAVSVPIVKNKLGLRLVASTEKIGGYTVIPSEDLENTNPADLEHWRASLLWIPTDRMVVKLQYAHSRTKQDGSLFLSSLDPPISRQAPGDFLEWAYDLFSGTFEYNFDFATLTSTTSYIDGNWDLLYNIAFPPAPDGILKFGYDTSTGTFNNETRLVSTSGGFVQWVGGVFYSESDITRDTDTNAPDFIPSSSSLVTSESLSVFGEVSLNLLDGKLIPLVGLRYFDDERAASATTLDEDLGPFTFDDTAPRFNLSYLPNPDATYYLNIAKGFRSGSFNTPGVCDVLHAGIGGLPCELAVPSDELWSYELGLKYALAGNSLFLEGAFYYQDWKGNRQTVSFAGVGSAYQVGDAVIPGIDVGLTYSPASLTGLAFQVTGNWNDAHFTEIDPRISEETGVEEGDRLPVVPEWTASFAASYDWKLGRKWRGAASVAYSHIEPQVGLFGSDAMGDSRDLLRARVGFTNGVFGINLFGTNLLGENGAIYLDAPVGGLPSMTQDYPRQVGLEVTYDF
jgi:iron complex outermembrane recepter protein